MEDFEVIQQAKDGDFSALEKWMDIYGPKIARFSFQCGSSLEQAGEVAQATFRTFQNELETIYGREQVLPALYKLAIEKLPSAQQVTYREEGLFLFEEDAEFHSELMKLDEKYRVPLILRLFHGFDLEQIAEILDSSAKEVEERIRAANEMLEIEISEGYLEKRLQLLGKSYDRLPVQFQAEHIIWKASFSEGETGKRRKKSKGKMLVIASIFLIGILSIQFFLPKKENEQAASNPYMNELEERYKAERSLRQNDLKLDDNHFNNLEFIKVADDRMNALKSIAQDDMEAEVEKIISSIKLPSEMVDDIVENPLYEDEEASITFLELYRDKVNDIIAVYNRILWDNREPIENFEVHSIVKKEEVLLLTSNKFPEELQNIFDTMYKQSIKLCMNDKTGQLSACYTISNSFSNEDINMKLQSNLHSNTYGYIMILNEPFHLELNKTTLNYWEYGNYLHMMQNTLLTGTKENELYPILESNFINFIYERIKGSESHKVFSDEGVVSNEFRESWNFLSNAYDATPLNYLVHPIVEEMNSSDWRSSSSWDQFSHRKIVEAIELGRSGKLETIMFGERPVVEDHAILLPDADFTKRVVELYNNFKISYDKNVFKGLSPNYLVGVFDYANEMEDPELMFHLIHKSVYNYMSSFEDFTAEFYISNYQKGLSLFRDAKEIKFYADQMFRYGKEYYATIQIPTKKSMVRTVDVILDENEIWYMQMTRLQPLPSTEEEPERMLDREFSNQVRQQYEMFSMYKETFDLGGWRAIDIVGLYFYAAEVGDYETQYALLFQDERNPLLDKEEFIKSMLTAGPQPKMDDMFKSISFKGKEQDENGNWPGVATLTVDLDKNPGGAPVKNLQMMWTENGWRVIFMPME